LPSIDTTSYHSSNSDPRTTAINCLVLHHGAGTRKSDLATLCSASSRVSAHYYVCRDGTIYQLVPDSRVAWHAGVSALNGRTDCNEFSLGIETEHTTDPKAGPVHHDWPQAQLASLAWLCQIKMAQYGIPTNRIVSHRAVALPIGRKTDPHDPPLGPEPAFRAWADSLAIPPRTSLPLHGCVLTHTDTLDSLEQKIMAGQHTTLKLISSWGLPAPWALDSRARACALTNTTVVRTQAGDPSCGHPYLHVEEVVSEIAPWYAIRRHNLFIELGNEPNADASIDPAGYAWHLTQAIAACRASFPLAKLIAPALILDRGAPEHWLSTSEFANAIKRCDLLGVHVYAYRAFDDTGQLAQANRLYAPFVQPLALTEYGINANDIADSAKGSAYARLVQTLPSRCALATYYHTDESTVLSLNDAAYALDLSGDIAYGKAIGGV
jgi:hypothetical protein